MISQLALFLLFLVGAFGLKTAVLNDLFRVQFLSERCINSLKKRRIYGMTKT